jgi:hypothetical protein
MGANLSGFNVFVLSMVGDISVDSEASIYGDFNNLEDLPGQSSKMLLGVGLHVCDSKVHNI